MDGCIWDIVDTMLTDVTLTPYSSLLSLSSNEVSSSPTWRRFAFNSRPCSSLSIMLQVRRPLRSRYSRHSRPCRPKGAGGLYHTPNRSADHCTGSWLVVTGPPTPFSISWSFLMLVGRMGHGLLTIVRAPGWLLLVPLFHHLLHGHSSRLWARHSSHVSRFSRVSHAGSDGPLLFEKQECAGYAAHSSCLDVVQCILSYPCVPRPELDGHLDSREELLEMPDRSRHSCLPLYPLQDNAPVLDGGIDGSLISSMPIGHEAGRRELR